MGGRSSQNKGKRFEREVALKASDVLGRKIYRTQQSRGGLTEGSDVVCEPYWSIECKHYKKLGGLIKRAYDQSKRDAKDGLVPIAICKGDRQEPLVTMSWDHFWTMAEAYVKSHQCSDESNTDI